MRNGREKTKEGRWRWSYRCRRGLRMRRWNFVEVPFAKGLLRRWRCRMTDGIGDAMLCIFFSFVRRVAIRWSVRPRNSSSSSNEWIAGSSWVSGSIRHRHPAARTGTHAGSIPPCAPHYFWLDSTVRACVRDVRRRDQPPRGGNGRTSRCADPDDASILRDSTSPPYSAPAHCGGRHPGYCTHKMTVPCSCHGVRTRRKTQRNRAAAADIPIDPCGNCSDFLRLDRNYKPSGFSVKFKNSNWTLNCNEICLDFCRFFQLFMVLVKSDDTERERVFDSVWGWWICPAPVKTRASTEKIYSVNHICSENMKTTIKSKNYTSESFTSP